MQNSEAPTRLGRGGRPGGARCAAVLVVAVLVALPTAAANRLVGLRLHDAPDSTRVVLDTREVAAYQVFTLENPHRVVVDLRDTWVSKAFRTPVPDSRVVGRIRSAYRNRTNYRVVLDLEAAVRFEEFTLQPIASYGHRLVIDLYPVDRPVAPPTPSRQDPRAARDAIVAIDAGHGGEDPGAIGVGRVYEKHVVLGIARRIKENLDAVKGVRGVLTRDGDYYVPLRKRTALARRDEVRADLFVSIHADAFRLSGVRGASVYALSERGASSEMARWLATSENRSDLIGGVGGSVSLDDKDDAVRELLVDLSMDAKREASITLGEAVLGSLSGVTRLHKNRVEQAGFAVLKSPDVPAVLIETGFLSNPQEARRLASRSFQHRLADAIAAGIQGYLQKHPPPDSLLASLGHEGMLRYVIKRGDTLSEIAERNRVSTGRLKALNGIGGDRILVGDVLLIPFGAPAVESGS